MRIPRVWSENNHEYIFIKQVNENMFLYEDMIYKYKRCFSKFDLGLVKEVIAPPKSDINPERVKK